MTLAHDERTRTLNAHPEMRLRGVSAMGGVSAVEFELCVPSLDAPEEAARIAGALPARLARGREAIRCQAGRTYVVAFDRAVLWRVIDDAFEGQHEGIGTLEGAILVAADRTRFLGMARSHTYAEIATGRVMRHYRINTLEALVDVASFTPPEVRIGG